MKRNIFIILLIASIATSAAQSSEKPNSSIGLAVNGGVNTLFLGPSLSPMNNYSTPVPGGFGGGEFIYELQYKAFLFRLGFGVDYSVCWNKYQAPDQSRSIAEYPTMQYHYRFSNYKEQTAMGLGYVPVMMGVEYKHFYFLVGTKLGVLPFLPTVQSTVDAYIWGTDNDVLNPMEGLYTHDMGEFSYKGDKRTIDLNQLNIMASFEIGASFGKKQPKLSRNASKEERYRELHRKKKFSECVHYKIALFADYGLSNMLSYKANSIPNYTENGVEANGGLIDIPEVSRVEPYSLYGYSPHKDAILHNLYAGIRFSVMYQIPHRAPKKGNMAYPHLVTVVRDGRNGKVLKGASVKMTGINPKNKKPQTVVKTTGGKDNNYDRACPPGKYDFIVTYPGFLPFDTTNFVHGEGFDTLYVDLYPQMVVSLKVIDALSKNPIDSKVTIFDEDGFKVKELDVDSGTTASVALDGRFTYKVWASSKGYFDSCFTATAKQPSLVMPLETKKVKKFILKNMYFATDKTKVLPSSQKALQELYTFLRDNPDVKIRIIGHTDDVASDEYNQKLSEGRANSTKQEMVRRGIDSRRIETLGKGEKEPIVENDSDYHRQMNRRVEIEVTAGDVEVEQIRGMVDK